MGFLIRRNLPLSWAGWRDAFQRPDENPVQWPWVHLGDGEVTKVIGNRLKIHGNFATTNGGGASYQWEPFTPNWGAEIDVYWPVDGLATHTFGFYFTDSWSRVGARFENLWAVRLMHAPAVGGVSVQYMEVDNVWVGGQNIHLWPSPVNFGQVSKIVLRVWVENDEWVRIWVNDIYIGSAMISPAYQSGPGRRCIRILNASLADAWVSSHNTFDKPPSVPPKQIWNEVFHDDFNRPSGSVGNGWTQLGADAGITEGDRYSHTGTQTDNSVGLIRNVGNLHGRSRIEAVVRNPSSNNGHLILHSNTEGSQALYAGIGSSGISLGRITSSMDGDPGYFEFKSLPVSVSDGDNIAFSVCNNISWIEKNGVPVLYSGNVHNVVSGSNPYAGVQVSRLDNVRSVQFDNVRIFSGAVT